jgi:hypothetical protein
MSVKLGRMERRCARCQELFEPEPFAPEQLYDKPWCRRAAKRDRQRSRAREAAAAKRTARVEAWLEAQQVICRSKRRYPDKNEALLRLMRVQALGDRPERSVYECPLGDHWHLTHKAPDGRFSFGLDALEVSLTSR